MHPSLLSDPDHPRHRPPSREAQQLARYSLAVMQAPTEEWLMAIFLDPQGYLLEPYTVFCGQECPIWADRYTDALLAAMAKARAPRVVTVRYHNHPWVKPTTRGLRQLEGLFWQLSGRGLVHRDHLILDRRGQVYSVRDQGESKSSGRGNGSARLISVPS